jgi:TPR repeat protein
MADLIIVHAHLDASRAEALAQALRTRGFDVALTGAQGAAKAVVALWSESALASEDVRRSAGEALARGALVGARVGPIEESNAVGPILVDLSGWPGPDGEAAFERLVQAAARLRGRPAMAAATRADDTLMRRALFGAGVVALVAVAAIALTPAMRPAPPAPAPSAEQAEPTGNAVEFTDSPGASETYGLTEDEIRTREPRALIELALERTAIETIEAEAARGDGLGLTLLCLAQTFGEGLQQDADGAERSCARASSARDGLATYMLSTFTRKGEGGAGANAADEAQADRLLHRAAAEGDPRAQTELARARLSADQGADAFALAQRAAAQGFAPAQVLIGEMYERGLGGFAQNYDQAMQWYARAERSGSAAGTRAIGVLYESGGGVAQDYSQARLRYEQASERGDGEASHRLARLMERGLGGERDIERARALYRRALAQGYAAAQADVERLGPG